jgi:anti-sigma B factor antagonist
VAEGELDLLTVYGLEGHVLSEAGPGDVVTLDLSATPFMDSTGLRVLLRLRQLAERSGWRLRVAGAPPQVRRMLALAGADKLLGLDQWFLGWVRAAGAGRRADSREGPLACGP